MKKQIVRISILQSGKIVAVLYGLFGLIYTLIGIPMIIFGEDKTRVIGIVYCFMPVLAVVLGFVFFAAFAAIYNLLTPRLGGIEVEVASVE